MQIPIASSHRNGQPRAVICDAHIPLHYVKGLSNGAIKKLAKRLSVTTVEGLYMVKKEEISDHIKSSRVREEIFRVRHTLEEKVRTRRELLRFEELAFNKNIKIKPCQKHQLTGVEVFAKILKDIGEVIKFILGINNESIDFRERAVLIKIHALSVQAIEKRTA